jgi:hypothetical protein
MVQDDFNSSFLAAMGGQVPPHDPRFVATEIIRRDHQRTRVLAFFCLLFWLLAAAGMLLLIYGLNRFVLFVRISDFGQAGPATQPANKIGPFEREMLWGTSLIHHSMPYLAGSVVALMLAALFTVWLIFSSRRATLNRINISLMQLAEELKQMRQAEGRGAVSANTQVGYTLEKQGGGGKLAFGVIIGLVVVVAAWLIYSPRTANPWHGYTQASPFQAIRWQGETPQVEVDGTWYQLMSVNDVTVDQIVAFSKSMGATTWQKHFNEDLVELLTLMGHAPGGTATLQVDDLNSPKVEVLKDVPMTQANWLAIWKAD